MALIVVETVVEQPLTDEALQEADSRALPCLQARNARWCYSLLSSNRQRMICTFEAPDVESVRVAYRKARVEFNRMWAAEMLVPEGATPMWNEPALKVLESSYPDGLTDQQWQEASQLMLPCYAERKIEWLRSYVSLDRTRVVCEFNAPDAEVIREAHHKFGVAFDRVWSAQLLKG